MATTNDNNIQKIKSRLSIIDVMRDYAVIEEKGGKYWVKCPFHGNGNEKTPSCMLDEDRGTYYCFACHNTGDIFTLVQQKEGLDFIAALEYLARKAGVTLESYQRGDSDKERAEKTEKEALFELNDRLSKTFAYMLRESKEGEKAREYLDRRNISQEMRDTFILGYAPSSPRWLYSFLKSKGYKDEFLLKTGLFAQRYPQFSLFQDRLMFPIRDRQGRVIAFSGRDLSGRDNVGKYINSPETVVYQKRENFFGLFEAKNEISKGISPIICEGNFDVVAMHQAGLRSAIASLGTAFTEQQCQSIRRWFSRVDSISLLFDSDEAGQRETEKAILLVSSNGLAVNVHSLKSCKDASELLEKRGAEGLLEEFKGSISGFEYLVKLYSKSYDINTAKGRSDFVRAMSLYVNGLTSQVERDSYILHMASVLGVAEDSIKEDLRKTRNDQRYRARSEESEEVEDKRDMRISLDLFAMLYLCCHRELFVQYRSGKINFGDLEDSDAQAIYMALENAMREDVSSDTLFLTFITDERLQSTVRMAMMLPEYRNASQEVLVEASYKIKLRGLERRRDVINDQIRLITDSSDDEEISELLSKKREIAERIQNLKKELRN